jgi:hypothetical protein
VTIPSGGDAKQFAIRRESGVNRRGAERNIRRRGVVEVNEKVISGHY